LFISGSSVSKTKVAKQKESSMKHLLLVLLTLEVSVGAGFAELIGKSYVIKNHSVSETWDNWPDSVSLEKGETFIFESTISKEVEETLFLAFKNWQGVESVTVTVDGGLATRVTEFWQPGTRVTYEKKGEIFELGLAKYFTAQYRWRPGGSSASTIRVEAKRRVTVFIPKAGTRWLGH